MIDGASRRDLVVVFTGLAPYGLNSPVVTSTPGGLDATWFEGGRSVTVAFLPAGGVSCRFESRDTCLFESAPAPSDRINCSQVARFLRTGAMLGLYNAS